MCRLEKKHFKEFKNGLEVRSSKTKLLFPLLMTMTYPHVSKYSQVFTDSFDASKCTMIVLKFPDCSELIRNFKSNDPDFNLFVYQIGTSKSADELTKNEIKTLLAIYENGGNIRNTEKSLVDRILKEIGKKDLEMVQVYLCILEEPDNFLKTKENLTIKSQYIFKPLSMENFDAIKMFYPPNRHSNFELSILLGFTIGVFTKNKNELVGWLMLSDTCKIYALRILQGHKRKGLGQILITKMVDFCNEQNIIPHGFTFLEESDHSFLESLGFKQYKDFIIKALISPK